MNKLENRIPPPILMVLVAIIMYFIAIITPTIYISNLTRWGLTAFLVILAGFFGPPAFKTFLMANTTTDPINIDKTSTLVTWGVYRYSRNPMYLSLTYFNMPFSFNSYLPSLFFVKNCPSST